MSKKLNSKYLKSNEIESMENVSFIRKQKRKPNTALSNLQLKEIHPLTENQGKVFNAYKHTDKHLILTGCAGSGKSFISLALALQDLFYGDNGYEKIIIIRSLSPGKLVGFLPGGIGEKQEPYFAPYYEMLYELFSRGDAAEILLKRDIIQFENTAFLRGITFNNAIVIVDEFQSANFHELDTIASRLGNNSRILFCGDHAQSDLIYNRNDVSGYPEFMKILSNMNEVDITNFQVEDIVRSGFVKNYIIEKMKLGL